VKGREDVVIYDREEEIARLRPVEPKASDEQRERFRSALNAALFCLRAAEEISDQTEHTRPNFSGDEIAFRIHELVDETEYLESMADRL
jgi:hypothetical protein